VRFDEVQDGLCVSEERSEDQELAVGKSSSFLIFEAAFQMLDCMSYDYGSETLDLGFFTIFYEDVIEISFDDGLCSRQRCIFQQTISAEDLLIGNEISGGVEYLAVNGKFNFFLAVGSEIKYLSGHFNVYFFLVGHLVSILVVSGRKHVLDLESGFLFYLLFAGGLFLFYKFFGFGD
jgi:hypothetical protein